MNDTKHYALFSMRLMQVLCIVATITGFVWATSDLLLATVLAKAPVTPLSVLLLVYGLMGSFGIELVIRLLNRKSKTFLLQSKPERETNG